MQAAAAAKYTVTLGRRSTLPEIWAAMAASRKVMPTAPISRVRYRRRPSQNTCRCHSTGLPLGRSPAASFSFHQKARSRMNPK